MNLPDRDDNDDFWIGSDPRFDKMLGEWCKLYLPRNTSILTPTLMRKFWISEVYDDDAHTKAKRMSAITQGHSETMGAGTYNLRSAKSAALAGKAITIAIFDGTIDFPHNDEIAPEALEARAKQLYKIFKDKRYKNSEDNQSDLHSDVEVNAGECSNEDDDDGEECEYENFTHQTPINAQPLIFLKSTILSFEKHREHVLLNFFGI